MLIHADPLAGLHHRQSPRVSYSSSVYNAFQFPSYTIVRQQKELNSITSSFMCDNR